MKLYKRTWAEVSLDALAHNYNSYREMLHGTPIMCVVKASCYGHSDCAAAPFLQNELGVTRFAVSNIDEAIRLRKLGITGDILILGYTQPDCAAELAEYGIIQATVDTDYARALSACAEKPVRCHAAVDTGMTRIGVRGTPEEIAEELLTQSRLPNISLEGAFTHYAVADTMTDSCREYTAAQADKLYTAVSIARGKGLDLQTVHSLNSAGGLFHYNDRSAVARLGIILYGLKPDTALDLPFELKQVMTLRSTVSLVKTIGKGTSVSYGRTYTADAPVKLATITCGYADGYPRALSNKGEILVHGRRCKIVGRVCMDQFMVDVTGVDVRAGDTVTLIGEENGEVITADDIAELTGTIGYEIVCGISERVPRAALSHGNTVGIYKL
ncbi:alanine racemase [Ruminococcus sp. YE71]|uniref:alanine racemase n=1 Tax=unclassified Ruminococcus TaxID=2608920 RepID=UPI00088D7014|nr:MULTISPECIES: alanine racemase [unclassified Ruminococcus]SDA31560.1 alanine racemase [Ruminococcus sp. YE78]SFW52266.1 alanine racemase [Ruminococcus sp. YE71]